MKALEYGIRDVTINILNRIKDRGDWATGPIVCL